MKYEELNKAIDLLVEGGFVKKIKPIWDNDLYEIMDKINKNYGIEESYVDSLNATLEHCLYENSYNVDLPREELPNDVADVLNPIFDYDEEDYPYLEHSSFFEFIEDLKEENPDMVQEIELALGDSFEKLYNGTITSITFLPEQEPSM